MNSKIRRRYLNQSWCWERTALSFYNFVIEICFFLLALIFLSGVWVI